MEAWLKSSSGSFKFPVVPQQHILDTGYKIDTEYLASGQQVSMFAGTDLRATSLTSHFPSNPDRSYMMDSDFIEPWECVRQIESIAKSSGEIRYIVTETDINLPVRITSFDYGLKDGSQDVEFTINYIEYKPPVAKPWTPPNLIKPTPGNHYANRKPYNKPGTTRPVVDLTKKNSGKIHTVKKGDCLWDIAQKYYKNGSLYKKIKNNAENQKKYPSLKKNNLIYSGWKLVIP